jgi:multiple sugar transport system substrate-binding protein
VPVEAFEVFYSRCSMKGIALFARFRFVISRFIGSHIDHILLALGFLVLLTGLLRWGGGNAIAAITAPTLTFTQWWQDELEAGVLEGLVSDFEKLHPEIKIVLRYLPYEETRTLFLAPPKAEGQEIGDILALDPLWGLTGREILEAPEAGESSQGIPVLGFFCPLFYNIEILASAGFSRPPKTREEFYNYVKQAADPGAGVYGLVMALESGNYRGLYRDVYSWIWAGGGRVNDEASAAAKDALGFLSGLAGENLLHPGSLEFDEDEKREAFINGRSIFMISAVQDTEILRRSMGEDAFGFSSIPAPDPYSGKPVFGSFGWSLGISGQSAYKDEAKIFAAFLAEQGSYLAEKLHAVPGNAGSPSPAARQDPFYSKAWDLYISGDFIREPAGTEVAADPAAAFREELARLLAGTRE